MCIIYIVRNFQIIRTDIPLNIFVNLFEQFNLIQLFF